MDEKDKERFQLVVIAALIQSSGEDIKDRFWHVSCRLREEMIEERFLPLFQALVRYHKLTGQIIDAEDLESALKGAGKTEAQVFEVMELYKKLVAVQAKVSTAKFKFAVDGLVDIIKSEKLAETLTDAMQVLTEGKMVGGAAIKGYDAAVKMIATRSTDLDRLSGVFPEGNMRDEIGLMRDEYKSIKANKAAVYIKTGIREIDEVTFGMTAGDLWLVGAYCQPEGEFVFTDGGFKKIEDVEIGDGVPLCGRVAGKWKFDPESLVSIRTDSLPAKLFTLQHPICVRRRTGPRTLTLVKAADVSAGDYLAIPVLQDAVIPEKLCFRLGSKHEHLKRGVSVEFNEDLMLLLAHYVSNGNPSANKSGQEDRLYSISISYGKRLYEDADKAEAILRKMGISFALKEYNHRTVYRRITFTGRPFVEWIVREFGRGALTKRLPGWLFKLPLNLTNAFLDNYLDGMRNIQGKRRSWTSYNREVMEGIVVLVAKRGKFGCLQEIKDGITAFPNSSGKHYRFTVQNTAGEKERPPGRGYHNFKVSTPGYVLTRVKSVIREEPRSVIGLKTTSGYYLTPFKVHNTSQGKTTLVENVIYNAAFVQGKNVVLGTAESTRAQVRRRLACLHCRKSPKFEGRVLRYKDIKGGGLSLPDEALYDEVLDDLKAGGYGRIQIFQMPYRCTPRYIYDRLIAYQTMFNIDLFALDYLNLVHSDRKRVEKREEIDEVIIEMKQIAVSFNGSGIPVLSPWQAKQAQWVEAAKLGRYTLAVLANTSESERSADVILTLLQMADEPGKLRAQILKNRDGEKILEPFELEEDFGCCYIGSKRQADDLLNVEE
jgi:replicative DNA helicase